MYLSVYIHVYVCVYVCIHVYMALEQIIRYRSEEHASPTPKAARGVSAPRDSGICLSEFKGRRQAIAYLLVVGSPYT